MERLQQKRQSTTTTSFLKKKDEKIDIFEGIKEKGTSSPKCASMGSLLDQRSNKLEKASNTSSEIIQ